MFNHNIDYACSLKELCSLLIKVLEKVLQSDFPSYILVLNHREHLFLSDIITPGKQKGAPVTC